VGVYTVNNNVVDIYIMAFFGIAGYVLRKRDYELAPLAIAFVLERLVEESLRQALTISHGSFKVFLSNPISFVCIFFSILIIIYSFLRREVFRKRV
jgi:putative tricarboxylic transport membrane protein